MNEVPDPAEPAPTATEQAEARAIRRRWITIGEGVAVVGVILAGLTFWSNWQDREQAAAERAAARSEETAEQRAARGRVMLITQSADAGGVTFTAQEGCTLESTAIRFPTALGVGEKSTVIDHRIDTDWIARQMLELTDGGADRRDGRLPVLIDATCSTTDGERRATAIYDLLWRTEPGAVLGIGGRELRLRGLVRREAVSGDGQRRLDSLWTGP